MTEMMPDYGGYNTGAAQANNHTEHLVAHIGALALGIGSVRTVLAGAAADYQSYSAATAAAASITGQSYAKISQGVRQLSRDLPVAQREALATVNAIQGLGLTSKGQERDVVALATTMTKLAGATGTFGPAMAASFGQLNRQMASLDPDRVKRFADSLTTVTAGTGTGQQTVDFARQIAPAASAAGMGETSVLGMSAAFAKLGDDSYVAVNAVNKMLTDLNRSVHEGTGEMAHYAAAVGLTTKEFAAMYQNNPTDAVNAVIGAVGKAGPQSQRIVDELGLGGQRGQRAMLDLAQQGGVAGAVASAQAGYGSGATDKASAEAFGGARDSLTRLDSAASQVAQTFERPLLHAATQIINLAGGATRGVGAAAAGIGHMGPFGGPLNWAAQLGLPLLLARTVGRMVSGGALGAFMLRSGPTTSAVAGFGAGRAGTAEQALERIPRTQGTANMLSAAAYAAPMGRTTNAARVNARLFQLGQGVGALMPYGGPGPSMASRAIGMGGMATGVYLRSQAEVLRQARMSPIERDQLRMRGYGTDMQRFAARRLELQNAVGQEIHGPVMPGQAALGTYGRVDYARAVTKEFGVLAENTRGASGALKQLGMGLASVGYQGTRTAVAGGGALLGGLGRMIASPMGLMAGGMVGYEMYQHHKAAGRADTERIENLLLPANSVRNRYNDALGVASQNTQSFADAVNSAATRISTATTNMGQATSVQPGERARVGGTTPVAKYKGTTAQVATQVAAAFTGGTAPSPTQMSRVKQDLIASGYSDKDITAITTGALAIQQEAGGGLSATATATTTGQATDQSRGTHPNVLEGVRRTILPDSTTDHAGKDARATIDALAQDVTTQFNAIANDPNKGPTVAAQWLFKTVNTIMAQLQGQAHRDNGRAYAYGSEVFSKLVTGFGVKGKGHKVQIRSGTVSPNQSFTQWLQQNGFNQFGPAGNPMGYWTKQGAGADQADIAPPGPSPAVLAQAAGAAPSFAGLMGGKTAPGMAAGQVKQFQTLESQGFGNQMQTNVLAQQLVQSALGQRGANAGNLSTQAIALGATNPALQPLTGAMQAQAGRQFSRQLAGMTQPQQWTAMTTQAMQGIAQLRQLQKQGINDPSLEQAISDYEDQLDQVQNAERDYYKNRIMAAYDFQKNWGRAQEQYRLGVQRQQEDAAKTLYNPYSRIAAQPVWDVKNLMGNEREQISAMRRQVANLKELKRLGLSQQAIDQLQLADPTKAQQTEEMVGELRRSHGEVGQLNRIASQRQAVGAQLTASDPNVRRAVQDHKRQMRYMREDYHETDLQLTGDMATLQKDMQKILHGQTVDFTGQLTNTWTAAVDSAASSSKDIKALLRGVVPKDLIEQLKQLQELLSGGPTMTGGEVAPTYINWATGEPVTTTGRPVAANGGPTMTFATGGIATSPVLAVIAEAGYNEAVIPLNPTGIHVLAEALTEAGRIAESDPARIRANMLEGLHAGGGNAHAVQISDHSVHHYDQGQHIHGPVTVKANTPAEWAHQARATQRKTNLTAPRSVRWSKQAVLG